MKNRILKTFLFENELFQWQAASRLGIAEETLSRKLRSDLPEAEQHELIQKIQQNAKEEC